MKIAVLGGAGQIGLYLTRFLNSAQGLSAVALCRSSLVAGPLAHEAVPFRVFSSSSPKSLSDALDDCDVVVDSTFAANSNLRRLETAEKFYSAVFGARRLKQVIHFSSVAVYGELSASSSTFENPKPDTIYGKQKLAIERLAQRIGRAHNVPTLVLRLGHVYGPDMPWSLTWAKMVVRAELPTRYLDQHSNAVDIGQVCRAVYTAIEREHSGCLNLLGIPNLTWRKIFDWHARALEMISMPSPDSQFRTYRLDPLRYQRGLAALAREAYLGIKGGAISGLTGSPLLAQAIRGLLAVLPCAPSVSTLKAKVSAPNLESYFSRVAPSEAEYIFDSVSLPGPVLESGILPEGRDLESLRRWLTAVLSPDAAQAYVQDRLSSAAFEGCLC